MRRWLAAGAVVNALMCALSLLTGHFLPALALNLPATVLCLILFATERGSKVAR